MDETITSVLKGISPEEPSGAVFSDCHRYRYALWRRWDTRKPMVMFIGLNPSTADASVDDPTMRRCGGFARSWGYGGFYMTNLFAYKATRPQDLKAAAHPIGPDNDQWITALAAQAERVVLAWGVHGTLQGRDKAVLGLLDEAWCIGLSKHGHPRHPLYLKADLQPQPFCLLTA